MHPKSFVAVLLSLTLCGSAIPAAPPKTADAFSKKLDKDRQALHVLSRLTYGPKAADLAAIKKAGVDRWIEAQLHPEKIQESSLLLSRLEPLESLQLSRAEILRKYPAPQTVVAYATGILPMPADPEERARIEQLSIRYRQRIEKKSPKGDVANPEMKEEETPAQRMGFRRGALASMAPAERREALMNFAPGQVLASDLQEAKLFRAVYSERQLEEILTDFWFNHFNVFLDKGADKFLLTTYERDAIRPFVLGKFRDMLGATAEHPAMLWFLDNWQSVSPDARPMRMGQKRKRGINENYGRELLELHTLGVEGGYTQKDITEVARAFTGWTIREPYRSGEFHFNARVHDRGEKVVLGTKIAAGGGKEDGEKVLDIVANHPSTAKFISRKLAQRFVADNPPEPLVTAMAGTFTKTGGDLREVLRTLFKSKEFMSEGAYRSKVKSPLEMVASSLRATGAHITSGVALAQRIAELGQPLYRKQEPTGYSNNSGEWVNSAGLLGRMNFALALTQNKIAGVRVEGTAFEGEPLAVAQRLLLADPAQQTRDAIQRGLEQKREPAAIAGLILGSPEFQRR